MADDVKPRLGKGLAALLGDIPAVGTREADRGLRQISIAFLNPNPRNPRRMFREDELADLAESVREKGIIQPILVRKLSVDVDNYEIIAGERRWRAAQRAGLHQVPVIVIEASDRETIELAIIENVQRADLNPVEEAHGYQQLLAEYSYTQADLSRVVGKSRSYITNMLRLLKLPDGARNLLESGDISMGHARALLSTKDPDTMAQLAVKKGLSVREIERLAKEERPQPRKPVEKPKKIPKDPNIELFEREFHSATGLSIAVEEKNGHGRVIVIYENLEQLEHIMSRLRLASR